MVFVCYTTMTWTERKGIPLRTLNSIRWHPGRVNNCCMLWISNTAVLSSSASLSISPPLLNQQFSTHDNNVVLTTAD